MTNENPVYGVESGDREMAAGTQWPWIRPKAGDRVRFHFLTSGSDPWLVATKFHPVGTGMQTRNYVCVSALTRGEEQCVLCDQDGGQTRRNMFGMWILAEYILHPHDNPNEEEDSWEQKKLKIEVGGETKTRAVFMEMLKTTLADESEVPGQAKFLWLPAGRQRVWWNQFSQTFMENQTFRKHFYQLYREGSGRDDTNWTLEIVKKNDSLDETLLEREDIKDLPPISEVFRSQLGAMPSGDAVLGSDSLDGSGEAEELPSAEKKDSGAPKAEVDDLI